MIIFLISAGCIFGGAVLGLWLSPLLPEGHLRDNSKDTVKVVTGMIATLAALVLGLLISSAKSSFDEVDTAITQNGAKIILLDRALANYGPETKTSASICAAPLSTGSRCSGPGKRPKEQDWRVSSGRMRWKCFRRGYASLRRRPTRSVSCARRQTN